MQYEVEFEIGDGDKEPETGIMIDIVSTSSSSFSAPRAKAIIVIGSGDIIVRDIDDITVVDEEIGQKFLAIEEKHQKLDLPVDIVERLPQGVK
jgi:hypothetical protein